MPAPTYPVDTLVDVRSDKNLTWRPGIVREVQVGQSESCYGVELQPPVTGDDWTGITRRYGGSDLVGTATNLVYVWEHTETLTPSEHIQAQGA